MFIVVDTCNTQKLLGITSFGSLLPCNNIYHNMHYGSVMAVCYLLMWLSDTYWNSEE